MQMSDETTEGGSGLRGSNGFDPVVAKRWMGEVDKHLDRLEELKIDHMNKAREVRDDLKAVFEVAKSAGIPRRVLMDAVKLRQLKDKINSIEEPEDAEHGESLEQFRHALGDLADLPLGQAAVEKKAAGMPGADAPSSLN
jgi:uncharacterized protein (UPF0335 family)